MSNIISVRNLQHSYGDLKVISDCNFTVAQGESVAITGKSGSGKSTLLHLLGGLDRIQHGDITINEQSLNTLDSDSAALFRLNNIGFIYQAHHLLPDFTALENCMMPLLINRIKKSIAKSKALDMLSEVGLVDRVSHYPSELSGGERQRVSIARALVSSPQCILADEPTGNLDNDTADEVFERLMQTSKEHTGCLIMVTHDVEIASKMDRTLNIKRGFLT